MPTSNNCEDRLTSQRNNNFSGVLYGYETRYLISGEAHKLHVSIIAVHKVFSKISGPQSTFTLLLASRLISHALTSYSLPLRYVTLRTARFNIPNPTRCLHYFECFVRISEQTVTLASYIIHRVVFITEEESVYSAVRTESLYNKDTSRNLTLSAPN
jgi:hypothetical protein